LINQRRPQLAANGQEPIPSSANLADGHARGKPKLAGARHLLGPDGTLAGHLRLYADGGGRAQAGQRSRKGPHAEEHPKISDLRAGSKLVTIGYQRRVSFAASTFFDRRKDKVTSHMVARAFSCLLWNLASAPAKEIV